MERTNEQHFQDHVIGQHLANADEEMRAGNNMTAWDHLNAALAMNARLREALPDDPEVKRAETVIWEKLGDVAMAFDDILMARNWFGMSLYARAKAAQTGKAREQRDLFVAHAKMAILEDYLGNPGVARACFEQARAAILPVADEFPDDLRRVDASLARLEGL